MFQYVDYVVKVMQAEMMIKIFMDAQQVGHGYAEKQLLDVMDTDTEWKKWDLQLKPLMSNSTQTCQLQRGAVVTHVLQDFWVKGHLMKDLVNPTWLYYRLGWLWQVVLVDSLLICLKLGPVLRNLTWTSCYGISVVAKISNPALEVYLRSSIVGSVRQQDPLQHHPAAGWSHGVCHSRNLLELFHACVQLSTWCCTFSVVSLSSIWSLHLISAEQ